jgi:hypothetical protein
MPKTTSEAAKAVTKATRLMPVEFWANPGLSGAALDVAAEADSVADAVAVDGNGTVELLICRCFLHKIA